MKRTLSLLMVFALLAGLAACAKKKIAQPSEEAAPATTESLVDKDKQKAAEGPGARDLQKETVGEKPLKPGEAAEREMSAEELQGKVQDIHFDYDRYDIREDARPILKEVVSLVTKNKGVKVIIEGHCDDRGTNEYNLALGERRAKATKDYLVSLGLPSSRIETVSYGEEKPLCTDSNEACWTKNRRAHFVFVREGR